MYIYKIKDVSLITQNAHVDWNGNLRYKQNTDEHVSIPYITLRRKIAKMLSYTFYWNRQFNNSGLSSCSSAEVLANQFVTFFENKIDKIRSRLEVPETSELFRSFDKCSLNCKIDTFSPTSITELWKISHTIIAKSCNLDPFPAALLKDHLDLLLPTLCRIVNLSLESGQLPSSLKTAVLSPLLKKLSLDHEVLA